MGNDHASRLNGVGESVLRAKGSTQLELRTTIASWTASLSTGATPPDLPPELASLVEKIGRHAYKVTPEDIDALKSKGYSEDQLFEITVSAALGAGLGRFERGMKALRGEV
jgi:hypothetical protein